MYSDSSTLWFGNSSINNNQAQIGAGIYLDNSTMHLSGNSDAEGNVTIFYGAGIYTRRTLLTLTGSNAFRHNTASHGRWRGDLSTANSTLNFNGNNTLQTVWQMLVVELCGYFETGQLHLFQKLFSSV